MVANAQMEANFAVLNSDEISMKECSFEPEAPAVILVDEGMTDYAGNSRMMTFYHQRIKVLKEEGKSYADFSASYQSEYDLEDITDIRAVVINFDEAGNKSVEEVQKQHIYRKKVSDKYTEVSFTFPNVKVGSIIEYRYQLAAKHYGRHRDWAFQSTIPVLRSSYEFRSPPNLEMSYRVQKDERYPVVIKPKRATNSIFFEMRDLPAFSTEAYMDSRIDYVQRVIFEISKYEGQFSVRNFMSNWNEVTKELFSRDDFGSQLKVRIDDCMEFIKTNVQSRSDFEKMQLLHQYIRKNIRWNNVHSLVSEDGVRDAWNKKSGNSATINLLLINLLNKAGLNAYPMLVSERGNGRINKSMPFISQFNSVYAAVMIGERFYYLDGTDPYTRCGLVPFKILNTTAFIADHKQGGLIDIAEPVEKGTKIVAVDAELGADGSLSGTVMVNSKDYERLERERNYHRNTSNYVKEYILPDAGNVPVTDFAIKNIDADSLALIESYGFRAAISETGGYYFIDPQMFTGNGTNPFLSKNRFSRINFGSRKTHIFSMSIKIPEKFSVDALPKSVKMTNADKTLSFSRDFVFNEQTRQLSARAKLDIGKGIFEVDEYEALREFYKKMYDLLDERIVLKDK